MEQHQLIPLLKIIQYYFIIYIKKKNTFNFSYKVSLLTFS